MEKDVTIQGLSLHYTDTGSGPHTLLLMHGWGCDHSTLASVERVALGCGYRVVNIDFPGFGQSQEPIEPWGVDQYTCAVEQLVSSLGIERPVLLGHSFGGRVAILYGSRQPDTKALVLVDAAGIKPRRPLKVRLKIAWFKSMKRLLQSLLPRQAAQRAVDWLRGRMGSSEQRAASPMMRAIHSRVVGEDLTGRLHLIQCPALLIWGERDTATPMRDARIMERGIPGAALVSFPGAGHYSFLDNPVQFAAVLRSFLTSDDLK